eukprot:TRINITY_DN32257_c0_g1_i1.p1 TRINITY_DN32257_c0_g1~~TRINITY_DN32257_c0_g1_i1.p1  ORF type:complete len:329 (+),score=114.61 TRINITY_DN32257_c0_g1_i1:64-1050(+)
MQRSSTSAAPMCRSRTDEFLQLRSQCGGRRGGGRAIPSLSGRATGYEQLRMEEGGRDDGRREPVVLPEWAEVLEEIQQEQKAVDTMLAKLAELHRKKNRPTGLFSAQDGQSDSVDIEILTSQISGQFRKTDEAIMKLELVQKRCRGEADQRAIKNIKTSAATQLGQLSHKFRGMQRTYLEDEKRRRKAAQGPTSASDDIRRWEEEDLEARTRDAAQLQKLSPEQAATLKLQNEMLHERDQELQDILKSLVEINEMFQHLNTMVIEQGTMLDRIDYNVQAAHEHVSKGVEVLHETDKKAKKNRFKQCVCFLIIMIALVSITLLAKDRKK